jgi:hypothetical protein
MAKSKKPSPKAAKKATKKAPKKAVKKAAKKAVKKVAKKAAKKVAKKPAKKSGKRFLIIYHAPMDAMAQTANVSPEQQAAGMALWKAWAAKVGSRLADMGAPLINGKSLNPKGSSAASTKEVAGYSLLDALDWEEVMDLLEGHPHISGWHPEATIEIHETMLLPGM